MWEKIEWPPRTPRSAWIFVLVTFILCLAGLGLAFLFPSAPEFDEDEMQATFEYTSGLGFSFSLVESLAKSGSRVAQLELGERYLAGVGVAPDAGQGLLWMQAASNNGYPRAHRRFAMFYDELLQGRADLKVSCAYHLRAAMAGSAESQFVVGQRYRDGQGFAVDLVEAYAWLNLASVSNLPAYRARVALEEGTSKMTAEDLARARARSRELLGQIRAARSGKQPRGS